MFTPTHFIWLFICIALIVGLFLLVKYARLSEKAVITILFCVCVASELIKTFANMEEGYQGGMHLDPGDLPFHLCSIQIFLVFALKFLVKNTQTQEKLLGFMSPSMLLGGVMALFIPTVGTSFTKLQVYQYFIFHATIIFFALYIVAQKRVRWTLKCWARNLGYLGILAMIATWINSILSIGFEKANFMYLSRPPMENLPILNLNNGWYAYFFALASIAIILLSAFHATTYFFFERKRNSASLTETDNNA